MGWLEKKALEARVWGDRLSPLKTGLKWYSWSFGGPLLWRLGKFGYKGLEKAVDGVTWAGYAGLETLKGTAEMTAKPLGMLALSRLITAKRFMWDVPLSTLSAAIRAPIALAKSPFEMAAGVREGIENLPRNGMEVLKNVKDLRFMDAARSLRKTIAETITPPINRPLKPIIEPFKNIGKEAWDAEVGQTVQTGVKGVTETIPAGWERIKAAPSTASGKISEKHAEAEAARAKLKEIEKIRQEKIREIINKERGGLPTRADIAAEMEKKAA